MLTVAPAVPQVTAAHAQGSLSWSVQNPTGEPKPVCHAAHSAEARSALLPVHAAADGPANLASVQGRVSIVNCKSEQRLGSVATGQRPCSVDPYTSSEQSAPAALQLEVQL